jgi:type VI secretion system secreted protein Hcp
MRLALRISIRRSLIGALVLALVGVGYFANVALDSSGSPHASVATKKLSAQDLLLAATSAEGIHLRYTGITTGPLNSDHSNDIPMLAFDFGVLRPVTTSASGARTIGKVKAQEVTLNHTTDSYSIPLLTASLKGAPATAILYLTDTSGIEGANLDYLEISLGQALITKFFTNSGGDRPSESFSINFTSMTFKYRIGNGGGPINTVTYNFATQK